MKIKRKKQLNLPQLIEWAWDNGVRDSEFQTVKNERGISYEACFSEDGNFYSNDELDSKDTFTVITEEEVTEDTVFECLIEKVANNSFCRLTDSSIDDWKDEDSKEFHAYIDGEFKLIWRDGRLIE